MLLWCDQVDGQHAAEVAAKAVRGRGSVAELKRATTTATSSKVFIILFFPDL